MSVAASGGESKVPETHLDPDVVLFEGPLHVITYMGEAVKEMTRRDPTGDPVRLAYVERDLRDTQAAMDRVYATGHCEVIHNRYGWVHLTALRGPAGIVGVAARHTYAARPVHRVRGHQPMERVG
jgi:hypothetical protein